MLRSLVKRESKMLNLEVYYSAKCQWDAEVVEISAKDSCTTLKNEDLGTFEAALVKATCEGCGEKFIALFVDRGQVIICSGCGHIQEEATTEELDNCGVHYSNK